MKLNSDKILMSHGGGGKAARDLISQIMLPIFGRPDLHNMDDGALLSLQGRSQIVYTTDSFVVSPLFFPGGDIGKLAVCGTVNDLAVMGADPKYLSCAMIIEEGFPVADLKKILESMKSAMDEAGVTVVAGDTKVVERGKADGLYINTSGIGILREDRNLGFDRIQTGDAIVVNGFLGDHGLTIMAERESMRFNAGIQSDCAPLNGMITAALDSGADIKFMRDMTRGGMAAVLNEIAEDAGAGIDIIESAAPVRQQASQFAAMLGLDPFYIANEGNALFVVANDHAEKLVSVLRNSKYGEAAAIVGSVTDSHKKKVMLKTKIGGTRLLDMPVGDLLPRIC